MQGIKPGTLRVPRACSTTQDMKLPSNAKLSASGSSDHLPCERHQRDGTQEHLILCPECWTLGPQLSERASCCCRRCLCPLPESLSSSTPGSLAPITHNLQFGVVCSRQSCEKRHVEFVGLSDESHKVAGLPRPKEMFPCSNSHTQNQGSEAGGFFLG